MLNIDDEEEAIETVPKVQLIITYNEMLFGKAYSTFNGGHGIRHPLFITMKGPPESDPNTGSIFHSKF